MSETPKKSFSKLGFSNRSPKVKVVHFKKKSLSVVPKIKNESQGHLRNFIESYVDILKEKDKKMKIKPGKGDLRHKPMKNLPSSNR